MSVSRKENPCVLTGGGVSAHGLSSWLLFLRSWFGAALGNVCRGGAGDFHVLVCELGTCRVRSLLSWSLRECCAP